MTGFELVVITLGAMALAGTFLLLQMEKEARRAKHKRSTNSAGPGAPIDAVIARLEVLGFTVVRDRQTYCPIGGIEIRKKPDDWEGFCSACKAGTADHIGFLTEQCTSTEDPLRVFRNTVGIACLRCGDVCQPSVGDINAGLFAPLFRNRVNFFEALRWLEWRAGRGSGDAYTLLLEEKFGSRLSAKSASKVATTPVADPIVISAVPMSDDPIAELRSLHEAKKQIEERENEIRGNLRAEIDLEHDLDPTFPPYEACSRETEKE